MVIALGTKGKKPGELMVGERIELVACHQAPDEMKPYERSWEMPPTATQPSSRLRTPRGGLACRGSDPSGHESALRVRDQHLGTAESGADSRTRKGLAQPRGQRGVPIT